MLCGKFCFSTEEEAKQHNSGMQTYYCRKCFAWHLTSGIVGKIQKPLRNGGLEIRKNAWYEWHERKNRNRRRKKK